MVHVAFFFGKEFSNCFAMVIPVLGCADREGSEQGMRHREIRGLRHGKPSRGGVEGHKEIRIRSPKPWESCRRLSSRGLVSRRLNEPLSRVPLRPPLALSKGMLRGAACLSAGLYPAWLLAGSQPVPED